MKARLPVLLMLSWLALTAHAAAEIPTAITYQGRLLDNEGRPLSTTVVVSVALYTNAAGGLPVHTETVGPVVVQNGIYSFQFGTNAVAMRAVLLAAECWLELVLNGQPLIPRQKLGAVPYAVRSGEADTVGSNTLFVPGVVPGAALADGAVAAGKLAAGAVGPAHLHADVYALFATGLPVYVESDPVYASERSLLATGLPVYAETDPRWAAASNLYYLRAEADSLFATGTPVYVEGDPVYLAERSLFATGVPVYAESDPVWQAEKSRYATGTPLYAESDPRWAAISNAYLTTNSAAVTYVRKAGDTMSGTLLLPAGGLTVGTTQLVVLANGNVGLGIANPTNRLAVNGTIRAKEVLVSLDAWPDYVFAPAYRLTPLAEVEAHIRRHGHLPGMPSAREVTGDGLALGEMQARVVRTIEELTLHLIALKKENADLKERLARLEAKQR